MKEILDFDRTNFSREEIVYFLSLKDNQQRLLFQFADRVRKKYLGDEVHLRGIIEFSNYCRNNCKYCGLRKDNKNLTRYRMTEKEIVETAKNAYLLGFKTIVLLLKKLEVDMAGIGPFIPHPDTPLGKSEKGDIELTLKVLAVARIVLKYPHLPATTAIGTIVSKGRQMALQCGANVIMPNVTPVKYRKYYQIYPNRICIYENPRKCKTCVGEIVKSQGKRISRGYGDSMRIKN